jgi:hypothetical protein
MWIRLTSFALCLAGFTAPAQSANESGFGLEACFQAARLADATCSNLPNDPARRVDCFTKARTAQLECLERVLSEARARSAAPGRASETARPAPQVDTAPPEASLERPDSKEDGRTDQPAVSIGSAPADEAAKRSSPSPKSTPASVPPSVAEAPTAALRSDTSGKKNDRPARGTDWILSETTSPVDYSPLINAVIRATSDVKDGPNSFAVRCRAQHTELSIRTDGAWAAPRGNDLVVDYQIDDQPVVRQPWILSTDGKTATYKNDPVGLLQSIPEGATLKVAVADKGNVRREATFELAGLSGIRQKIGTACKWAPVTAKTSSEKR